MIFNQYKSSKCHINHVFVNLIPRKYLMSAQSTTALLVNKPYHQEPDLNNISNIENIVYKNYQSQTENIL